MITKLGYHLALKWALWKRRAYVRRLPGRPGLRPNDRPDIPVTLYAFSGAKDLPEQVASLRSFFRFAGVPQRVVVVGDGSHGPAEVHVLRSLHARIETVPWSDCLRTDLPERCLRYAADHPLGKKIAVLMSIPPDGPWIFADSDILFFPAARDLARRVEEPGDGVEFLEDCYPSLDDRLLEGEAEKHPPVNSGFVLVRRPLDWSVAWERFRAMPGEPGYFTEQTLFHLAVRASRGRALPSSRYVIRSDDQWTARDRHVGPEVVLRHYFSSLRYKMWLAIPRQD